MQGAAIFEWANGNSFNPSTDFAPWAPGEPKVANGKCVASLSTPDNFLWTMHDCSDYEFGSLNFFVRYQFYIGALVKIVLTAECIANG